MTEQHIKLVGGSMVAGLILFAIVAHFVVFERGGLGTDLPATLLAIPAALALTALVAGPVVQRKIGGPTGAVCAMALGEGTGFVGLVLAMLVGAEAWGIAFALAGCLAVGRVLLVDA